MSTKISGMAVATSVGAADLIPIVQAGVNKSAIPGLVNAVSVALSARSLNSTIAPSATNDVLVIASVEIATGIGGDGKVEFLSDASNPPTTIQSTIRLGTASAVTDTVLIGLCKAGQNYSLKTTSTGGSPTFSVVGSVLEISF